GFITASRYCIANRYVVFRTIQRFAPKPKPRNNLKGLLCNPFKLFLVVGLVIAVRDENNILLSKHCFQKSQKMRGGTAATHLLAFLLR
ncbi:MAG: hypothetical protein ACK568_14325, partial [Pseudanabaena sp.]